MIARQLFVFAMVAAVSAAPALAAKQIVVRSSGPSAKAYPVGRQLPSGAKVSLRQGDSLTVLGPSKARVLQGPGRFNLAVAEESEPFSRSRFSARRGPPVPRGPWAVDIGQSGRVCAMSKQPLSLWRSAAESDASVTIRGSGDQSATLDWPAGTQTLEWPSDLPLRDGLTYKVEVAGNAAPAEWTIASVRPADDDHSATAEALLAGGCETQLEQLVERALWNN